MKAFSIGKLIKILIAFTLLSALFLFSPFSLFHQKSSEVKSSIDVTYKKDSNALESDDFFMSDEVCSVCVGTTLPEVASITSKEEVRNKAELIQPNCSLSEEVFNRDFRAYEKEGFVYVEIFGEITAKKGSAAYDFVRKQGCLTSSPNLVFLNE